MKYEQIKINFKWRGNNYKAVTLALTLVLGLSYVGLVSVFATAVAESVTKPSRSYGRNAAIQTNDLTAHITPEYIGTLKQEWQRKLEQAESMLSLLEEKRQVSVETTK